MEHLYKTLVVSHLKGLGIVTKEDSFNMLKTIFPNCKGSGSKVNNIYMGRKLYQN